MSRTSKLYKIPAFPSYVTIVSILILVFRRFIYADDENASQSVENEGFNDELRPEFFQNTGSEPYERTVASKCYSSFNCVEEEVNKGEVKSSKSNH